MKFLSKHLVIASMLTFLSIQSSHAIVIKNNLGRTFDFRSVEQLIKLPKNLLVSEIENSGVTILLSKTTNSPANEVFKNTAYATKELFEEVSIYEEYPSEEAEFISEYNPENYLKKNIIVIAHDADALTLIHEYMHYLAYKQIPDDKKETFSNYGFTAGRSEYRMKDRFNRIMRNPMYMESAHWRKDMMNAIDDTSGELGDAINYSLSEEVVIEKALRIMVKPGNEYYNSSRLEVGKEYSKSVISNIAVKIRDIDFLIRWFTDEIRSLDDLLEPGELEATNKEYEIVVGRILKLVETYQGLETVLADGI